MRLLGTALLGLFFSATLTGQSAGSIRIHRAPGPISVDGNVDDPGWKDAARIDRFYELSPGDNTPAKVRTTAYLTYDDRFFYVAVVCEDPDPHAIRAQYTERDHFGSEQDFIGIMLDTRNDDRTALELFVNPYGIEDDFVRDESNFSGNNEDVAPDFYWDAAARITSTGWQAELRIPFSTLRYSSADPQTWGISVFRNYPRDFRYQIASNPSPRESNCFVCHALKIEGLSGLPHGAHVVVAPYATLREQGVPREGPGSSLRQKPVRGNGGLDLKFLPSENLALDATVNPDFSQIESDVAQISTNARFALFYPEKRPFFMEQSQLYYTPIQAVYTRTITSPRWGVRATGQFDANAYTVITGEDRGGGTVILPGAASSSSAPQDFHSIFGIARIQHAFSGRSFVSLLATDREIEGGGYNRVAGPDFQWIPGEHDQVAGQLLLSWTQTPNRPDLAAEWTGNRLDSRAMYVAWNHSSYHWNTSVLYRDLGDSFRADDGFVPQVGIREGNASINYVFYTGGFFSRAIPFVTIDSIADANGHAVSKVVEPGISVQGKAGLNGEVDYNAEDLERAGPKLLHAERWHFQLSANPPGPISAVRLDVLAGRSIDFIDFRSGHGGSFTLTTTARPTRHLQLDANLSGQWLYLSGRRLFKAQVERLKGTYVFNSTTFIRAIGQYVRTDFDPSLYTSRVPRTTGAFDGSALVGYQLNWQSVLYVGYGDSRALDEQGQLQRNGREFFLKVSYAFQR
jgi:hypothetical protein